MNPRFVGISVVAVGLTIGSGAFAQVSAANAALAEKLFEDARDLMAQGKYGDACAKLAESERLDPGVGTLLNLADCFEKSGKVASAWATYREAEAAATRAAQKKRAQFANARARALAPDLSFLVVEAPSPPAGLQVTADGKELGATTLGTEMPFDSGTHKVEAQAPGRRPWSTEVEVPMRGKLHVVVPALEVLPEAPGPGPIETPPPTTPPTTAPNPARSSGYTVAAIALGAVGVVGIGVGSYFGLHAKSLHDDAETNHCDPATCDAQGVSLTKDARTNAAISTIAFTAGAVALVAGVVVYLVAPKTSAAAALGPATLWHWGLRPNHPQSCAFGAPLHFF